MKISADVNRIETDDGRVFVAEESYGGGCSDCDLLNTADCCDQACSSEERSDGRDMIFKEVKQERAWLENAACGNKQ